MIRQISPKYTLTEVHMIQYVLLFINFKIQIVSCQACTLFNLRKIDKLYVDVLRSFSSIILPNYAADELFLAGHKLCQFRSYIVTNGTIYRPNQLHSVSHF